jgi:ketosteroid isomerase-like protein
MTIYTTHVTGWTRSTSSCLLMALLFAFGCTKSVVETGQENEAEIIAVLNQQVAAWNRADIPAFMETYVKGDSLRFSSGGNVRRGWQATYERYLSSYPTPEAMGHLDFEDMEVLQLSEQWAQVHGRYRLKRSGDYADATGLFTLLLKNTGEGWKILHDHTSAGE